MEIATMMEEALDREDEARFGDAQLCARGLKKLTTDQRLRLYGLFKQAMVGDCEASRPGLLDQTGRAKWDAWNAVKGASSKEAKTGYVEFVDQLAPGWEIMKMDAPREDGQVTGSGSDLTPVQSTLLHAEGQCEDSGAAIAWGEHEVLLESASRGELDTLVKALKAGADPMSEDEEGRTALHWAADRGYLEAARTMIAAGTPVDCRDADGLTPLAYAITCDHVDIVMALIEAGADPRAQDDEGVTPLESASAEMRERIETWITNGAVQ